LSNPRFFLALGFTSHDPSGVAQYEEKAMKLFKQLTRLASRSSNNQTRPHKPGRAKLNLEGLETRLLPASVFVVPISQLTDSTHFHSLSTALPAAGTEGVITIEPGASPDPLQVPVTVNQPRVTIQGDPNVPASILPAYQLNIQTGLVKLGNLNISTLIVGTAGSVNVAGGANVHNCLINNLTAFDNGSSYTQNIFTGTATFDQGPNGGNEVIANNTFTSGASSILSLTNCAGVTVANNVFFANGIANAIFVRNTHSFNDGVTTFPAVIANNSITFPGSVGGNGIVVQQDGTAISDLRILNNRFDSNGKGQGIVMSMSNGDDTHFRAFVQGNDFHNNAVGLAVIGDGTHAGLIDAGGGALGSVGGNDFRGFTKPTGISKAAIEVSNATFGLVLARQNIFSNGVTPADVTFAGTGGGFTDVQEPLSSQRASIQALFNEVLGRSGTLADLDGWVNVLNGQGQAAVVNGILRSSESLGRIVDAFYIRFLGRQSDTSGRNGWVNFLKQNGTEEQLENLFLTSPEYLGHINTDFVQSLYINILGRTGTAPELAGWNNKIQQIGLAGIASGFTGSNENRTNSLNANFQVFLHRTPTSAEVSALVGSGADLLSLEAAVLSLPEYFANG
jgi:hypothetical protein